MVGAWLPPRGDGLRALGPVVLVVALLAPPGRSAAQRVQLPPPAFTPAAPPAAPAFDPYATATVAPYGPPPASVPYSYAPPAVTPTSPWGAPVAPSYSYAAPPPVNGFSSDASPLGWQPGTYGFESSDGATVRFRRFLARLRAEHTLLLGDDTRDGLTLNRTEVASTFAWPITGSIETPLLITPGFAFNGFDGPMGDPADPPQPDLPPRVYDAYLDFAWNPRFAPEIGAELGFRTGVWTDFEEFNGDTMRFLGRGLVVASITPQFEALFGAVYLDRLRVKTLPAGGVRWRPTPEWDLYLVFPNPKIRRTLRSTGSADWWWYVSGEYGGGSWTIERDASQTRDRFDYNDIRVAFGLEWQTPTQARGHVEIGYAFDRELLFDSGAPARFKTDDAVMFRAGIGF